MFSGINTSFFFLAKKYSSVWMYHVLFIHSSADGGSSCFHFLVLRKNVAVSICEQFFFLHRAEPTACGSSQAKGRLGAVAAGLRYSHSNTRSEPRLWPTPQVMAMPDLLTHRTRPGIEPASSWIPVGFIIARPWRELLNEISYYTSCHGFRHRHTHTGAHPSTPPKH